jgi:hypothetical protein
MDSLTRRLSALAALAVCLCVIGPAAMAGPSCPAQPSPTDSPRARSDQRAQVEAAQCLQVAQQQSSPCGNDRQCWGTPWSDNAKQYICYPMAKTCSADQDGYPVCK